MANDKIFTCISCSASENGGFILKLQNKADKVETTAFGTVTQKAQETYYMKVGGVVTIGTTGPLELEKFKITPLPYVLPEGSENAGETVQLKWLFL